jgi:hypothetical protein
MELGMKRFVWMCLILAVVMCCGVANATLIKDFHQSDDENQLLKSYAQYEPQHEQKFMQLSQNFSGENRNHGNAYAYGHDFDQHGNGYGHGNGHGNGHDPNCPAPVPEPATILLMGSAGVVGLFSKVRKRFI